MPYFRISAALALGLPVFFGLPGCASEQSPSPSPPPVLASALTQFQFHSAFLINMHHFLIDAARHPARFEAVRWDAKPDSSEMAALQDAMAFYVRTFGTRDPLFDDEMRDIKHALAHADDARQTADGLGLPPALAAVLDRAAPAYARCLWKSQDRMNRDWIAAVQPLQARYGAQIQARLERIFDSPFPASIRDDVVVDTGTFAGAYTDAPPPHSVLPSGRVKYAGLASLEMIWHEAAHTGPSEKLETLIASEAQRMGRPLPEDLWHAALFKAVGVTVSEVLAEGGRPGYTEYAEKNGVYGVYGVWAPYTQLMRAGWIAWVEGEGSMTTAVDAMLVEQPTVLPAPTD